jgi:hypothetical protein
MKSRNALDKVREGTAVVVALRLTLAVCVLDGGLKISTLFTVPAGLATAPSR